MASLVESGKHGSINTTDTKTNGFYVVMFTSEAYTIQDNTTLDGRIITAEELVVKAQCICSMQVDTNLVLESTSPTVFHHSSNMHNTSSMTRS